MKPNSRRQSSAKVHNTSHARHIKRSTHTVPRRRISNRTSSGIYTSPSSPSPDHYRSFVSQSNNHNNANNIDKPHEYGFKPLSHDSIASNIDDIRSHAQPTTDNSMHIVLPGSAEYDKIRQKHMGNTGTDPHIDPYGIHHDTTTATTSSSQTIHTNNNTSRYNTDYDFSGTTGTSGIHKPTNPRLQRLLKQAATSTSSSSSTTTNQVNPQNIIDIDIDNPQQTSSSFSNRDAKGNFAFSNPLNSNKDTLSSQRLQNQFIERRGDELLQHLKNENTDAASSSSTTTTQESDNKQATNIGHIGRLDHDLEQASFSRTLFYGLSPNIIVLNGMAFAGSVIATPTMNYLWKPRKWSEVTPESLSILNFMYPQPDMILFGCGALPQAIDPSVHYYLKTLNLSYELYSTYVAMGTFNLLNEEFRKVITFCISLDEVEHYDSEAFKQRHTKY